MQLHVTYPILFFLSYFSIATANRPKATTSTSGVANGTLIEPNVDGLPDLISNVSTALSLQTIEN